MAFRRCFEEINIHLGPPRSAFDTITRHRDDTEVPVPGLCWGATESNSLVRGRRGWVRHVILWGPGGDGSQVEDILYPRIDMRRGNISKGKR